MVEVDTQDILEDIRQATQAGEQNQLFFLLVATPGGAPKAFHNNVIIPFLKCRGWQKVSYRNTGFRALYFLHDKPRDEDDEANFRSTSTDYRCPRCRTSEFDANNNNEPLEKKRKSSKGANAAGDDTLPEQVTCNNCFGFTSTQRASKDRKDLKVVVERYKASKGGAFQVHMILSQPVDYEEDFLEFASQPGAIEE